jgi:hypothetical protein
MDFGSRYYGQNSKLALGLTGEASTELGLAAEEVARASEVEVLAGNGSELKLDPEPTPAIAVHCRTT